jgi:IclR family KDG regulon transcriptional repressor
MDEIANFSSADAASSDVPLVNTTFVHGLALLDALGRAGAPRGVSELARELNLTKSNVHRLLQTLGAHGYTRNLDASGRYEATLKLWELGAELLEKVDVKQVAVEDMERLAQLSGESVHLTMLDRGEVLFLDKLDHERPKRGWSKAGGRAPAYCLATGKAQLAHAPAAAVDKVMAELKRYTASTIVDPAALRGELAQVRNAGYAINHCEWHEGFSGVAAPIRDRRGAVVAAIGVSGPAQRLKAHELKSLAPQVIAVAEAVSTRLGWHPNSA